MLDDLVELLQNARIVERGQRVRHTGHRGEAASYRRFRSRRDGLFLGETRLAQMHVHVDEARSDDTAGRIDHRLAALRFELRGDLNDAPAVNADVACGVERGRRIDDSAAADEQARHWPLTSKSSTAMRTATPWCTCRA